MDNLELARTDLLGFIYTMMKGEYMIAPHHRILCNAVQRAIDTPGSRLIVNMPPRHGKCEHSYSLIWMADGSTKKIKDVKVGDLILSTDGTKVCYDKVISKIHSGKKKMLRITLSDGTKIEVTPEHRLKKWEDWVESSELKVGDELTVCNSWEPKEYSSLTSDDAFLLALF